MKKIIFGVFAHPDDEAFGPCGTLLHETRAGSELHLITLTGGEAGTNPDNLEDLGKIRLEEWREAGNLIGARSMHHFDYQDGTLNNQDMIEITQRLIKLVSSVLEQMPGDDITVEFMTLDLNGYTGHIDHMVATRAACQAFYTVKKQDTRLSRIRLACLSSRDWPEQNTDWIYMEAGRSEQEIDETVDARNLHEDILTIMRTHHTQRSDGEAQIARMGENLGLNYFIVKT